MKHKIALFRLIPARKLIIVLLTGFLTCHTAQAIVHHGKKHSEQNTKLGNIILLPQPNNAFSAIAYQLNKTDMEFAIHHGEKPLILIGIANLSSNRKSQKVLFTQLQSASLCGSGGCTTTAYLKRNNHWVKILDSVSGSIEIKKTAHKGMHDLLVESSDLWIWNKNTYVETQSGPNMNGLKKSIEIYQKDK